MDTIEDGLWLAFAKLAKTYPHDQGVRITADLARWLLEERQRLQQPAPPILHKVVSSLIRELDARAAAMVPGRAVQP